MPWPVCKNDIDAARARIAPHLQVTPLRHYPALDAIVGHGIRVLVKHENHQPTNSFKVRNGLSAVLACGEEQRRRGFIAATKGNHGQGVAYAGAKVGAPVTICVPLGNSPAKNRAMRDLGAELIEEGRDYDFVYVVEPKPSISADLYEGASHSGWAAFEVTEINILTHTFEKDEDEDKRDKELLRLSKEYPPLVYSIDELIIDYYNRIKNDYENVVS